MIPCQPVKLSNETDFRFPEVVSLRLLNDKNVVVGIKQTIFVPFKVSGNTLMRSCLLSYTKGVNFQRKEFAPRGANSFL